MKKRVIALMSGGVDSSVSAALLKDQGYDVIGVYILGWTGTPEFPCSWQDEEADARAVAEKLEIPFYTLNLSKEYEQAVIDEFFADYRAGVTPNPDILCNREIKFKAVWQAVRQFEPEYLATGHYAQLRQVASGKAQAAKSFEVFKGVDQGKDQSYFLWGIGREILPHILFPLGDLKKAEVRKLAEKYGLSTAKKKDSQGICFVGPLKVREFLVSELKTKPGEAILADGRVVARHQGVQLYTIGQRLAAGSVDWTGDVPPLFVVAKDLKNNRLIVGPDSATFAERLIAVTPNWLTEVSLPLTAKAKTRYRQEDVTVTVAETPAGLEVNFSQPVRALTPGQSIVFYQNDQLLGGAIISRVPSQEELLQYGDERPRRSAKAETPAF